MELQALLVLCGVGVAGVAVVLLMGLFSTSGTSYEEAIAQQRRATTELLALAENKNKSKKSNKKAIKKQAKKESKNKDSVTLASGSEVESEAPADSGVDEAPPVKPHVEFSPPVVVDVLRDVPPNVKIRKRGKDSKVKPILINKDDPSIVTDPSTPPSPTGSIVSNHFEKIHPKDEFELLHSSITMEKSVEKEDVAEKKEVKPLKASKAGKTVKQSPVQESAKEDVVKETRNNNEAPKDQRNKGKKLEKRNVDNVVESVREEVVPPLNVPQPQELTTEKLLRQAPMPPAPLAPASTANKHKKKKHEPADVLALMAGDGGGINVNELVEVVKSATLSRTEIQILTDALLNKHHDPLPAHSEWTEGPNDPVQKLKKQLADKEKALVAEVEASQALQARFKELRASLAAERTRAAAAARAADTAAAAADAAAAAADAAAADAAAAAADAAAGRAREQRLLDDHLALAQDNKMLQSKLSNEAEVQAQRVQMEMHIQRLSESEAALAAQLGALQAELQARALELGAARCEARDSALAAQHAADLAQQLQESGRVCAELEQQRQLAARNEQRLTQELCQAQERLHAMSELQNEVQKLTARAQSAESTVEKSKEESEKQKQQITKELASLKEVLAAKEAELAEIKQMKVPAQNGLPSTNDTHKMEGALSALSAQLAAAQRTSAQQHEQLAALTRELQRHQDKNNELRTKNWKVMEALQSAEKALQAKSSAMPPAQNSIRESLEKAQALQYKEIASILSSARPDLSPKGDEGRDWVQRFASNLSRDSRDITAAPTHDLVEQNRHLQGLVDKYKTVIHDTEAVLSRLQQNVTVEEQRWRQQLADKQRELDELNNKTILQMQKKIDSLQAELHQASKHSNNFTDAERLKEETLMGSLSEKYKVDVCNGPLQVGLTEK